MTLNPSKPPWLSEQFFRAEYKQMLVMSKQGGARVVQFDDELVLKTGNRVTRAEEIAMKLVREHTDVPVPEVFASIYEPAQGRFAMSYVSGTTLDKLWDHLDTGTKETLCRQVWEMIKQIRQIPKPSELQHLFLCLADGSHSTDPLVCNQKGHPLLLDDDAVRARIFERYYESNGRKYEKELPAILPRSTQSVFSHGDISPRNIICDPLSMRITAIIDWETAGWFPDYWEFAVIMRPSSDKDWQAWMDCTAPQRWDISGITAARGVLLLPI